jgi:polyhydroxybutyrate depolymerase
MKQHLALKFTILILLWFTATTIGFAQENLKTMEWTVDGQTRKALVYIPTASSSKAMPLVFAFHGHGGTSLNMYKTHRFDQLWPEAILVFPQGLNTPGMLTDPEGKKSGWVMNDQTDGNRDLQFFDAMLATLRKTYQVDNNRIYATGHSNGGGFTYLLWAVRSNEFAAFAPTATAAGKLIGKLTPKPALHLMGENDPLVKPFMQKLTYNAVLKINGCATQGVKIDSNITKYEGKNGNDLLLFIHSGGHSYPQSANPAIVNFFQHHVKK